MRWRRKQRFPGAGHSAERKFKQLRRQNIREQFEALLPVSGKEWCPPCVTVARLRRAVFSPPPGWEAPG